MAKKIQGITIEIGGDTTKLGKALEDSTKKSSSLQKELQTVNRMLKFDPSSVDLLTQKQDILTEQVAATSEQVNILHDAQAQVQAQFEAGDIGADQYRAFQREVYTAESRLDALQNTLAATTEQLTNAKNGTSDTSTAFEDLTDTVQQQERRLNDLKAEYANVVLEQGENSAAAAALRGDIADLNTSLQDNRQRLQQASTAGDDFIASLRDVDGNSENVDDALDTLTRTIEEQEKALADLADEYKNTVLEYGENSKEAKSLKDDLSNLNTELGDNKKKLSDAQGAADKLTPALQDVGDGAEQSGDGFTIMGGVIADLTSSVIQSAVGAIGDLVGSLFDLIEATEEYRSMQSKLAGSAEAFGYSAEFSQQQFEKFYSYLGDDQMATNAITNLMGLKASTDTVSAAADAAIGVWAAYGDSIPIEGLTESINESAQVAQVTGSLADAINWAKRSNEDWTEAMRGHNDAQAAFNQAIKDGETQEDAFSAALAACSDEQERADLIAQTLQETYDVSRETYANTAGSIMDMNSAELELKDTQAEVAEAVSPITTAMTELKNDALESLLPIIEDMADAFMDLYNWLQQNPVVFEAVKGAALGLAAAFGVLAGALAIQGIITGVQKALSLLNGTMLANPIVLVVAAIAGLVAAFVYLWNNCEEFRQFWIDLWNKIVEVVGPIWEQIQQFIADAWEKIKEVLEPVVQFFSDIFNHIWEELQEFWEILQPYIETAVAIITQIFDTVAPIIGGVFQSAWDIIQAVWSQVAPFFAAVWATIQNIFSVVASVLGGFFSTAWTVIQSVWNVATSFFQMIWDGIQAIFAVVGAVLSGDFSAAWDAIKNVWNSVVGFFQSIWDGIKNIFGSVGSWFGDVFSKAWTAVKNVFSSWGSFFGGLWNTIGSTFSKIGTNIANAIGNAVKSGINGVISSIEGIINSGINLINGAIDLINLIPGVNIGHLGRLSLPRLAAGGYVTGNTLAEMGENDKKEVVLPLERNLGWAQSLADILMDNMRAELASIIPAMPDGLNLMRSVDMYSDRAAQTARPIQELVDLVSEYFPKLVKASQHQLVLDSGVLVGELAPGINQTLGDLETLKRRGG